MQLINNLTDGYKYLSADFIGLHIDKLIILNFFFNVLLALGLMFIFYQMGEIITTLLSIKRKDFLFFKRGALGYIVFGTGIGILGLLTLLTKETIVLYIICLLLLPLVSFWRSYRKDNYSNLISKIKSFFLTNNNLVFWTVVFFVDWKSALL